MRYSAFREHVSVPLWWGPPPSLSWALGMMVVWVALERCGLPVTAQGVADHAASGMVGRQYLDSASVR